MISDLQEYLQDLSKQDPEAILEINEETPQDFFLTSLAMKLEKKQEHSVLFQKNIKNHTIPVVANIFASRERIAKMLATTPLQMHEEWMNRVKCLIDPTQVSYGPVKEVISLGVDINLTKLPISKHFLQDGGRYVSSGIIVAKDPDTGTYNLSYHRLQLKEDNRFGISLHSRGHLWDYFKRSELSGKSLEVAVIIGCHPLIYLAASSRMPIDISEYAVAGALFQEPLKLVACPGNGILVPNNAEIVFEGRILKEVREPEGPFGEYTGYATNRSTENVLEITGVMHKKEPIYQDLIPGYSSEHLLLGRIPKEAEVIMKVKNSFPYVQKVNFPKSGTHFHAYMSMKKTAEGQAKQALMLLLGLDMYLKFVVAVDEDIDVYNEEEVLWALATRMQADKDVFIVNSVMCNLLDPSSAAGMSDKMGIDATAPIIWDVELCQTDAQSDQLATHWLEKHTNH